MSFWDGITGSEKDAFSDDFEAIPAGTELAAEITDVKVSTGGKFYYQFTWKVVGGEFENRLLWQYLSVKDEKPMKAKRDKNVLMYLYKTIAKLPIPNVEPNEGDLVPFIGKRAKLLIDEYDGKNKKGETVSKNKIAEVHPLEGGIQSMFSRAAEVVKDTADDGIPF